MTPYTANNTHNELTHKVDIGTTAIQNIKFQSLPPSSHQQIKERSSTKEKTTQKLLINPCIFYISLERHGWKVTLTGAQRHPTVKQKLQFTHQSPSCAYMRSLLQHPVASDEAQQNMISCPKFGLA